MTFLNKFYDKIVGLVLTEPIHSDKKEPRKEDKTIYDSIVHYHLNKV